MIHLFGYILVKLKMCHIWLGHQSKQLLSSICYWESFVLFQLVLLAQLRKQPKTNKKTQSSNTQKQIFENIACIQITQRFFVPLLKFQSIQDAPFPSIFESYASNCPLSLKKKSFLKTIKIIRRHAWINTRQCLVLFKPDYKTC